MSAAGAEYHVVFLHDHPNLLEDTAILLNKQWQRSLEARKHSIEHSVATLPCSMLLINDDKVYGHVRLLQINRNDKGALIESLLIDPNLRGRGYGRLLMKAAEDHLKSLGYETVHLSTHDQHVFYKHIGYIKGPRVDAVKMCNIKIMNETNPVDDSCYDVSTDDSTPSSVEAPPLSVATPILPSSSVPPPPLPPPIKTITVDENMMMKWYMKQL